MKNDISNIAHTAMYVIWLWYYWPPLPSRHGPHHFDLLALLILGQDTVQGEAVVAVLKYHEVHRQLVKGNTTPETERRNQ
jgi:hypothetical protein